MDDVLRHPELPWTWDGLCWSPNITLAFVLNNRFRYPHWKWRENNENDDLDWENNEFNYSHWNYLSSRMSIYDISSNLNLPWY